MHIVVRYFAVLREQAARESERISLSDTSLMSLYAGLSDKYGFSLDARRVRVAVNDEFVGWDHSIQEGDTVVFIPPVAGG